MTKLDATLFEHKREGKNTHLVTSFSLAIEMAPLISRLIVAVIALLGPMRVSRAYRSASMMMHTGTGMMKAAVFVEKGRIEIRQKPIPIPG